MRKALRENEVKKEKTKKTRVSVTQKINFKRIKLNKKSRIAIIVLIVLVLIIILVSNYTTFGLVLNKNISNKDIIQLELKSSNDNIYGYKENVLVYETGNLLCYNKFGKLKWEISIDDTINADINISGDYIQIINKDKNIVYIYKNKYEVSRIKIKDDISSGNINSEGMSIIEYNYSGSKKAIAIYDKYGSHKYDVKLNNNTIGKSVLSDDSRYLAYIDVDISGISAFTSVNVIDLKNIKEDELNYKTAFSENNTLVYDIYWYGKSIIIRTDENYIVYNVSNSDTKIKAITNNSYESVGGYNLKYAYIKLDDKTKHYLTLTNVLNDKEKNIELEESPKYFYYKHGLAYLCYSKKIEIYNNFGMKIKDYSSDTIITKPVIFDDGKGIAFTISNKLIIFTI